MEHTSDALQYKNETHELNELKNESVSDNESDNDGVDMIGVITAKEHRDKMIRRYLVCIIILVFSLIVIASLTIYIGRFSINSADSDSPRSHSDNIDIQHYVLPNTTVTVSIDTQTSIKGEFVMGVIDYQFASISNETAEFISFINVNERGNNWIGFKLNHLNDSKLVLELYHSKSGIYTIEFAKNELNKEDTILLDSFLENLLCEHYVELSIKLGSVGYIGSNNHAIEDLHRFAQWMWKYQVVDGPAYNVTFKNDQWVDITQEFEKVNIIISASKNAGFWVSDMNEIMTFTSNEYSVDSTKNGRSLLGNCEVDLLQSVCGNDCYGMCGSSCSCWSWLCGDCRCWQGCKAHDYYCSCKSKYNGCCINVFWVKCDGTGSC